MSADQPSRDDALDEVSRPEAGATEEPATEGRATEEPATDSAEEPAADSAVAAGEEHEVGEPDGDAGAGEEADEPVDRNDRGDPDDPDGLDEPHGRPRAAWRTPVFAVTRAVVVAALATAGYLLLIPQTHTVPSRLAKLVVPDTGLSAFPGPAPQSQSEPVGSSGIKSMTAANKAHPDKTGIWVSQWAGTGNAASDGVAVVVFEAPDAATAQQVVGDLRPQTVDAKTTSQSFSKSASFSIAGIPGSQGALYANNAAQAGQPSRLASILWQQGRVVGLVEEVADAGTQQQAESLAQREAALLRANEPGFSEKVTTYPLAATIVWWAVAAVVLVLVVGGPIVLGRMRRRREAERRAQLEAQVRGHSAIAKRRRPVASSGGPTR